MPLVTCGLTRLDERLPSQAAEFRRSKQYLYGFIKDGRSASFPVPLGFAFAGQRDALSVREVCQSAGSMFPSLMVQSISLRFRAGQGSLFMI